MICVCTETYHTSLWWHCVLINKLSWLSAAQNNGVYILSGYVKIVIENGHGNSEFTQLQNGGSFHSYVTVYQRVCMFICLMQDCGTSNLCICLFVYIEFFITLNHHSCIYGIITLYAYSPSGSTRSGNSCWRNLSGNVKTLNWRCCNIGHFFDGLIAWTIYIYIHGLVGTSNVFKFDLFPSWR